MHLNDGIIEIDGVKFYPGYTFNDFKKTPFYTNQDGIRQIKLQGEKNILNHEFIVNILFIKYKLYSITLFSVESLKNISFENEPIRKNYHDKILLDWGLKPNNIYSWGKIESIYDEKSNVSEIGFFYK